MRTINYEWQTFKKTMLSKEATDEEIQTVKKIFYGGVASCLRIVQDINKPHIVPAAKIAVAQNLIEELKMYRDGYITKT